MQDNGNVENVLEENIISDDVRAKLDDSSSSCHSNNEEIFSNSNLSRMDKSYLRLTPLEYMNDEVVEAVQIPESCRQIIEEKNMKVCMIQLMKIICEHAFQLVVLSIGFVCITVLRLGEKV